MCNITENKPTADRMKSNTDGTYVGNYYYSKNSEFYQVFSVLLVICSCISLAAAYDLAVCLLVFIQI